MNGREVSSVENETVRALPSNEIEGGSADEADVGFGVFRGRRILGNV